MANWMVAEKAATYLKKKDPNTMIKENTLRYLTKHGFPCLQIDSRTLINMDTFEDDLVKYSQEQTKGSNVKQTSPIKKLS